MTDKAMQYQQFILRMIKQIEDETDLKQIYTIVHRKFINQKINDTAEEKS